MNPVKKECRDNKDERSYCRDNVPCHYEALPDNKFVATTRTIESMLPTLTPAEVVGIIMAHYNYKESFLDAVTVDLESFCRTKTNILSIDDAFMEDDHKVEDIFPEVWKCFFTDPVQKIRTITCFKNNLVTEEYLSDHQSMASGLKHVINSILIKTKLHFQTLQEEEKDWRVAMRKSFYNAVSAAVTPNTVWGSHIEHDIATRLNLDSTHITRSTVSTISETQFKLGTQVGALSKAVIADKLDKAEEVLVIRNLDMIPPHGTFNAKFNAVMSYFGANGTCVLEGVKEFYALSTDKRIVYIRFQTKKAK